MMSATYLAKIVSIGVYILTVIVLLRKDRRLLAGSEVNLKAGKCLVDSSKNFTQGGKVMKWVRYFALLVCLASSAFCFAGGEDWLPVTPQDLEFKQVPGNSGAPAVILYHRHDIDDNTQSEFRYFRIKVLNAKGQQYADVEIPVLNIRVEMTDLKARTIRPNGSMVEFNGKVFEKTLFKGRGVKLAVKAFTMPEVSEGCIIEYKYMLVYRKHTFPFTSDRWVLQHALYTVKENFPFSPYEEGGFQKPTHANYTWDTTRVSYVSLNMKDKPKSTGNFVGYSLQGVPAFESEGYMPPEDNYKPSVRFFYLRKGNPATDKVWREIGQDAYEVEERDLAGNVKEAAAEAIGNETDPEKKLRRLYARVQQIRNLSFEHQRTLEERKKENLKVNNTVGDVLAHGYGSSYEITMLFIAMARSAGFETSIVHASNRKEIFFSKDLLSLGELETVLAAVQVNGTEMYLEPGTRFCPFGLLSWTYTATDALKLDKKGGSFIKIPPAEQDKSTTRRTANVTLGEDGGLKGEIIVEFKGQEALERRLDAVEHDEAAKRKDLEDEMKEWLPAGAAVKMAESQGWEATDSSLLARFTVEVPGYASTAGKRLLLPSYLFQVKQKDTFSHNERKYPVYFPYAFAELDRVTIQLPPGVSVESVPQQQDAKLPYARYQNASQSDGLRLVTQRALLFNGIYFELNRYSELKDFFSKVRLGDEQQVVLRGGKVNAQKDN